MNTPQMLTDEQMDALEEIERRGGVVTREEWETICGMRDLGVMKSGAVRRSDIELLGGVELTDAGRAYMALTKTLKAEAGRPVCPVCYGAASWQVVSPDGMTSYGWQDCDACKGTGIAKPQSEG